MPTAATITYSVNRLDPLFPQDPPKVIRVAVKATGAVQTLAAGTVMGEVTATPGTFAPYASGNVDGSQNPIGVLQYAITVDTSGNITYTTVTGQVGGEFGVTYSSVPIYYEGEFRTQDLTGLDANAAGKLGRLIEGSVTTGIIHIS